MIGFKILICVAAIALAPAAMAHASEPEASISENSVQNEEIIEQVDQDPEILPPLSDYFDTIDTTVSEELVSGSDQDPSEDPVYNVMPLADYDTYYGSISTTYVEYMRGYLSKLEPDMHYVGARTGQYEYIFAFSNTLTYSNGLFSGSDVYVVTWNTQNQGYFNSTIQSSFSLDVGSYLVYTDLGFDYPALATSSDISLRQIVFITAISISFYTLSSFMVRKSFRFRSKRWRV